MDQNFRWKPIFGEKEREIWKLHQSCIFSHHLNFHKIVLFQEIASEASNLHFQIIWIFTPKMRICNCVIFLKNMILKMWILWKIWFSKCELGEKWDFQKVNFWMNWWFLPQCVGGGLNFRPLLSIKCYCIQCSLYSRLFKARLHCPFYTLV